MCRRSEYRLAAVFLILTGILNIFDYFYTNIVIAAGAQELNPFMAPLIGTRYFALVKLALVPGLLLLVWLLRSRVAPSCLSLYSFMLFLCYLILIIMSSLTVF